MKSELKNRFATYRLDNKESRLSLTTIKREFGASILKVLLREGKIKLTDRQSLELIGETISQDGAKEKACKVTYQELVESFPSLTYEWLLGEADKQIAGGQPSGSPGMFLNGNLKELGVIK